MHNEEYVFNEAPTNNEVGIGIGLGLGYFTIFPVIPFLILTRIFGMPESGSLQDTWVSAVSQVITAFIVIGLMMLVSKRVLPYMIKNFSMQAVWSGLKYAILAYFLVIGYGILDELIFGSSSVNENQSQVELLVKSFPLIGVIFTVIAAPVIEEVTYRYYLYKGIEKRSVVLAFIVTVFLFAAMHLIPSLASGTLIEDLRSLPAYLLASFLFTFAYYRSKKIMVPIIAHMIYNGFAVLMLLVAF